ncbi:DUF6385 domain-containing protein, partial [Paenibacillus tyrfis]|uniref:DUF6385 domain-containing protein n=1 Tax=Paenibacillus tyrfis TaxID=1501230 RepID=UPI0024921EF4
NLLNGTITSVLGATITAGTLTTVSSVLGATITAGSISATLLGGTITNLLNGTITSVLGATITAGTLTTVGSILGATITAGTITAILGGTLTAISQNSFVEQSFLAVPAGTATTFAPLAAITTAVLETYSFFVYNSSPVGTVDTILEISANGTNWFTDVSSFNLSPGSVDVLVPQRFLKYTRLSYRASTTLVTGTIDVIFNAQGS